jgi:hypothetical protein
MDTTTTPKRKAPTKAEAMKALIELERKLMVKENEEAKALHQRAEEELKQATLQYVSENFDTLKAHLEVGSCGWRIEASIKFFSAPRLDEDDSDHHRIPMPPNLKELHTKLEEIDDRPNGYVDHIPDRDIRKRIEDKLKAVSADAVINAQVERTPVVKEYLEEFLASLTKASKAAERLSS